MAVNKIRQFGNRTIPTLKDKIQFTDIINDTTTGGTQKPLSAEQGKVLSTNLNQEISDRTQAIIDLKGGVALDGNTLNKLNLKINQETADRQSAIAQEVADRDAAILVEKTRAVAEESRLEALIGTSTTVSDTTLSAEIARATSEEARIETKLDSEITTRTSEIGILNGDASVAGSVDQKVKVETDRAVSAESVLQTNINNEESARISADTALQTSLTNLTNTVNSNKTAIESALTTEINNRTSADTALSDRLFAIESGLTAGVMWKGSVADMTALDALVENELLVGWAYYVAAEKDVYVVLPDAFGDYKPSGWSSKSFLKIADFSELSGLVSAEKNRAVAAETLLATNLTTEVNTRTTEIARVEGLLNNEVSDRTTADTALSNRIDAEVTARINADSALDTAYKAADAVLDGKLNTEIANRIANVDAEETRATNAETALDNKINTEIANRIADVNTEETRAMAAESAIDARVTQEIADRKADVDAEEARAIAAENGLDGRVAILEADSTTAGSVAAAEFNAKAYADKWIPMLKLEGMGGNLSVVGDTVSTVYVPMVDGVLLGEVVVYTGDNDSEAVAVNVANIAGNVITLDVVTAGEFDGKKCKVHYLFREGDQVGAGIGISGEGGAGF